MRKFLFLTLLCSFLVSTASAQITNGQLNYELRVDQWRQTCDNDGLSNDDNEVRIGLTSDGNTGGAATWTSGGNGATCGGNNYVRRWQADAPSTVTNNNTLLYICTNRNPVADFFTINYESWEEDGSPDCSSSGDACVATGTIAYTFRSAAKTSSAWWANNGTSGGAFITGASGDFFAKTTWRYTYGDVCGNALNFGTMVSGVAKTHVNANRPAPAGASGSMGYNAVSGNAAPDVFYQFTLSASSTVAISTANAGSNYDTYLRLYNSTSCGTQIAFDDDGGGGALSLINITLCAGTYVVQVEGFSANMGDFNLSVLANTLVFNPGSIAGITNGVTICYGTDPGAFTSGADASNGAATYTYQWESSTTSAAAGYGNIGGATNNIYDPAALTQTTWFRRRATDACGTVVYSNVIQVIVNPGLSGAGLATGDYMWYGNISNDWTVAGNWFVYNGATFTLAAAAPTAASNVFIPSISGCISNIPNTLTNTCNALNVTLQAGGRLNIGTGSTLNVNGSWYNNSGNATYVNALANSTVVFPNNALPTREIAGNTTTTFDNYTTNYTGFVTINIFTNIANTLTMNGNFTLNNRLVLGTSAASTGTLVYSVGNGRMAGPSFFRRYFNTVTNTGNTGLFPLGISPAVFYRGAQFDFTTAPTGGGWIEGRFVATPLTLYNGLPILNDAGVNINNYMDEGYWEMNTGGGFTGGTYSLTLNRDGVALVSTPANLRIIKSPGPGHTIWVADGTHGTVTATTVSRTGMSGFSWFVISSNGSNPLPVELLSFNVGCKNNTVELLWKTATEINNHQFVLERSLDGINWTEMGRVAGAGNSNTLREYAYTDVSPVKGSSYYRLVQQDFDGQITTYDPVYIQCDITDNKVNMIVYPNPSDGAFNIRLYAGENEVGEGSVTILDMSGRTVMLKNIQIGKGENVYNMGDMELTAGMYHLVVYSKDNRMGTAKLVIRK